VTPPESRNESRWDTLIWHHEIHAHLREQLVYFLLNFVPFNVQDIKTMLGELIRTQGLGGIRAFALFGSSDLLLRVWLPRGVEADVRLALKDLSTCKSPFKQFTVSKIERRLYADRDARVSWTAGHWTSTKTRSN
jgi:hypothetical protein